MPTNDPTTTTRHEVLIALHVTDEAEYQRYRDAMTPILHAMGGSFAFDARMSEVLKGDADSEANRVFVLSFPDEATKDRFFADPGYKAVRAEHFDPSVGEVAVIGTYTRLA